MAWIVAACCLVWAFGALLFDFPMASMRQPVAGAFAMVALGLGLLLRGKLRRLLAVMSAFGAVLIWWLSLQPRNDRPWQPDVAEVAWAEFDGDDVTFHNVRNFEYRTELDYTPHWETRSVRLSHLTGADLALGFWGSPYIAHPIASFQFTDAPPLCFSIETRKQTGQKYSAIGGLYRQFTLIYVVADERDVIRLRTNYRKEDIYLYRTTMSPEQARERFLEYMKSLNELRIRPRWYNAATDNCTTGIRNQHPTAKRLDWDWRLLANGTVDEMMYERNMLVTGGLPFVDLKARSLIDQQARAADQDPEFSRKIREGLPGF